MRHSRDNPPPRCPPSEYTRAAPAPPSRRLLRSRSSLPAVAVGVLLAAGIVLILASGLLRPSPAHRLTPDAVPTTPAAPPPSVPSPEGAPAPPAASTTRTREPDGTPVRPRTSGVPRAERKAPAGASARPAPRVPRPRPAPRPRSTRRPPDGPPPTPAWITAECRRRYPRDATRRAACVAALTGLGGRR
ncbi:hypothetical protein [Actinomadura sp. NEAU-AAG7]|uniref:hypothetical protein n=1 Tax=Actinomadura sp. NEAU-AAG7 TaxID=2839640 RepID=UPI001BE4D682|nr:hypothetical protein [Actinomadura sp. NEAU-AAG7]MBT2209971.1 hypothetical protein [Actinomadura sp. NEAU-AAG7]